jgi:hypothetical protein
VVLHLGDDDLVARAERQHVGHQVERLGGVLREDDLARIGGANEGRDLDPGAFVERRRLFGEGVDSAVDVGVVVLVVVAHGIEHLQRLL